MTHEPRRDELLDLVLGLLEADRARALEAHAAGCDACRAELSELRQTRELLAGLPPIEAPGRGAAVILAAARQAAEAAGMERRPRWAAPRWLWGGTLGLAGAAALAVLVLRVTGPTDTGPFSDHREALLGQAAPVAVDEFAAPAKEETAEAPRPRREPPAKALAPAGRARDTIGIRGALGDAVDVAVPAPTRAPAPASTRAPTPAPAPAPARAPAPNMAPTPVAPPPAAMATRAEPAAEFRAEQAAEAGRAYATNQAEPSARARRSEAPAAMKKARASAPDAMLPRAAAGAEGAPCRLEQRRRVTRDAAGQVIGRLRQGRYPADEGEVPLTVEERFGPDGRLLGATVRAGDRLITVSDADVAAGRLEPLPGVVLARNAAEAVGAAPRCEP